MAWLSHFLAESRRIQVKFALDSPQNNVSPVVKPHFREKLKKSLFYTLASAGASSVLLIPLLASAGFSLGGLIMGVMQPSASSSPAFNSQTVPLLAPAVNIDPKPPVGGGDITVVGGSALMVQEGPSGTPADLAERPVSSAISVYTVREGDTVSQIAEMFGVSVNTIIAANERIKNRSIQPGDELVILPMTGLRHTVAKGDTIESIAKKYQGDADEIARTNELSGNGALAVGSTILIPDGVLAAPTPAKSSSTARSSSGTGVSLGVSGGPAISGYYIWPVRGGVRTQGLHGYNGIDIGAAQGTAILASAAGTVIVANGGGGWNGGYGNYVVIQHNNGTQTLYAHASAVHVSAGQQVSQGEVIAAMGRTGKSTGVHLHFEVRGAKNPF